MGEYVETFWNWFKHNAEPVLALFTIVLAGVTGGLWWWTRRLALDAKESGQAQASLNREALQLAHREFVSTHRPKLNIRHVWATGELWEGGEIRATAQIVNVGVTDADLVDYGMKLLVVSDPKPLPTPPNYETSCSIGKRLSSGEHHDLLSPGAVSISDELSSGIRFGKQRLYCIEYVRYSDGDGRVRTAAFCRVLEPPQGPGANSEIGRFRLHNDSEYEYQD